MYFCRKLKECVNFVEIVSFLRKKVTLPLSAGRITVSSSIFSRFGTSYLALVKFLSCSDTNCVVEAIFLLMLSLPLNTISSVGFRFGVTECY